MLILPFVKKINKQQEIETYLGWVQGEEEKKTIGRISHLKEHQENIWA